jgi:ribosomal-protein-alanine N-acetyltransferase
MHLRAFHPEDLETLFIIDQACFPPGISYSREELSGFISQRRGRTWVAEEEGEIAGFLVAGRQTRKAGHIVTIDVLERWRRRKVGSLLMDAVEDWAREQNLLFIYLEAQEDNTAAHAFYEARNYRRVDRVENYYPDGTAAWVMLKWLRSPPSRQGRRPGF